MTQVSRLTVTENAQQKIYLLHKPVIDIGRGSQNDVVILESRVSRRHARIAREGDHWRVEDLGSANGTQVNGAPRTLADLGPQDVITIGGASLTLAWVDAPALDDSPTLLQVPMLNTQADVDQTLADQPLLASVQDTSLPRVAVRFEGRIWEQTLRGDRLTIGRAPENDIVLLEEKVSRHHAQLELRGGHVFLSDLHSSNGTLVDGRRVEQHELRGTEDIRIGAARLTFKPAFSAEHLAPQAGPAPHSPSARSPVVVVPGFMGSQLWRGSDMLWPDMRDFIRSPESFALPGGDDLVPRGIVNDIIVVPNFIKLEQYTRLTHFLSDGLGYQEGKDLHVFAYDWRKDLRLAARRLATEMESFQQALDDPSRPVTIIAHSMGCLVTRYYIDRLGGDQHVGRAILMGGPHLGIPKFIVAILAGLSVLPFGLMGERLRAVIASFPSAYQTLPTYPCVFDEGGNPIDIFADERWLPEASRVNLKDGFAFRAELSPQARVPTTCIFGYGNKTVSKVRVRLLPGGQWSNPQFIEENNGDNTIPDASAILHGADIHPVQQQHGTLYTDSDVKMRLKLELTRP